MKNPIEVLRAKEQELLQVKREIDALRVALPLLSEEEVPVRMPSVFAGPHGHGSQKVVPLP